MTTKSVDPTSTLDAKKADVPLASESKQGNEMTTISKTVSDDAEETKEMASRKNKRRSNNDKVKAADNKKETKMKDTKTKHKKDAKKILGADAKKKSGEKDVEKKEGKIDGKEKDAGAEEKKEMNKNVKAETKKQVSDDEDEDDESTPPIPLGTKIFKIFEKGDKCIIAEGVLKEYGPVEGETEYLFLVQHDDGDLEDLKVAEVEQLIRDEKNGKLQKCLEELNQPLKPPIAIGTDLQNLFWDDEKDVRELVNGKLVAYERVVTNCGLELCFKVKYDNQEEEHLTVEQVKRRLHQMKTGKLAKTAKESNIIINEDGTTKDDDEVEDDGDGEDFLDGSASGSSKTKRKIWTEGKKQPGSKRARKA